MSALERIKEISESNPWICCFHEKLWFVKAFNKMREIAIKHYDLPEPSPKGEAETLVDSEFEREMK